MLANFKSKHDSESGQASAFAVLVAALLAVFVLALLCTGGVLFFRNGDQAEELGATSTAIAQANATTLAQNAQVTQTIAAMETEAARPTNTPTATPRPTDTPTATSTPVPTDTPVVEELEPGAGEETPTPNIFGTSIFQGGATAVPGGTGNGAGTGGGTLPQTGVGLGTAIAAAFGLLFLLLVARRLRTG